MTYEQEAIVEALRAVPGFRSLTTEEEKRIAEVMVLSLHEQRFRLTSDGPSFDD